MMSALPTNSRLAHIAQQMSDCLLRSWESGAPLWHVDAMWEALIDEPHPRGGTMYYPAHYVHLTMAPYIQAIYLHTLQRYTEKHDIVLKIGE